MIFLEKIEKMDFLEELNNFCLSNDFETCIEILKTKLKHQSQMDVYDSLYIPFVKTISKNEEYWNIIIPGLEYFIKLISLCLIYKNELFNEEVELSEEDLSFISNSFNKQYTMRTFFGTISQIIDLPYKILFEEEQNDRLYNIRFSDKRICCIYFLLHNAGNLSFNTSVNMLLNDDFTKSFFVGKIISSNNGPHGGFFDTPSDSIDHDYDHYRTTVVAFNNYDISKLIDLRNSLPNDSLRKRFINIFSQAYIFEENRFRYEENLKENTKMNILDEYQEYLENPFEYYDDFDIIHIIKYLIEAYDINSKLSKNELNYIIKLNDNFLPLIKGLKQTYNNEQQINIEEGDRFIDMNFSYLNGYILDYDYNEEYIHDEIEQQEKMGHKYSDDEKINLYYLNIIKEYINKNSMEIYTIIKQYI